MDQFDDIGFGEAGLISFSSLKRVWALLTGVGVCCAGSLGDATGGELALSRFSESSISS
jgi:hypothetical protein